MKKLESSKKASILDAMRQLITDGRAADCSVNEIARAAGIGKGSIYYYYRSKREIEMDLFHKTYSGFVEKCESLLTIQANTLEKLKILFGTYYSESTDAAMDDYLHLPQNMDMHQKVLSMLVTAISPILSKIIDQGIEEGVFKCSKSGDYAQIFASVFAFLFDAGIFELTAEETLSKLSAFSEIMEKSLNAEPGYLSFVHDQGFLLSLPKVENRKAPFRLPNA